MKSLKNEQGFTLVELMVVVAIIGILSAVAIPNFKRYQSKSKQSEAKLQLASIYTAETSLMADYDAFATCLAFAGYAGPTASNYYGVGFSVADGAAPSGQATVLLNGGAGCASGEDLSWWAANKTVQGKIVDTVAELVVSSVSANGNTFTAGASGWISSDAAVEDDWTIDEDKQLVNTAPGL